MVLALTRRPGSRLLAWAAIAIYAAAWGWLALGLLEIGRPLIAAVGVALLIGLASVQAQAGSSQSETRGAVAALLAGAAWLLGGTVVAAWDPLGASAIGSGAALYLLPALLALRTRESQRADDPGATWLAIGSVPIFAGAALAGGVLSPLSGDYAGVAVAGGGLLTLAGAVPFAVVAMRSRVVSAVGPTLILVGAVVELVAGAAGGGQTIGVAAGAGAFAFGAGWIWVGRALLVDPRGGSDEPHAR